MFFHEVAGVAVIHSLRTALSLTGEAGACVQTPKAPCEDCSPLQLYSEKYQLFFLLKGATDPGISD